MRLPFQRNGNVRLCHQSNVPLITMLSLNYYYYCFYLFIIINLLYYYDYFLFYYYHYLLLIHFIIIIVLCILLLFYYYYHYYCFYVCLIINLLYYYCYSFSSQSPDFRVAVGTLRMHGVLPSLGNAQLQAEALANEVRAYSLEDDDMITLMNIPFGTKKRRLYCSIFKSDPLIMDSPKPYTYHIHILVD